MESKYKVIFNEEDHTYHCGNLRLTSVSEIVNKFFPFEKPRELTQEKWDKILPLAIKRGNCVHSALEFYANNSINIECGCEPKVKTHNKQIDNGIEMLNAWLKKGYKVAYTEELKHLGGVAGTIDLVLINEIKNKWIIIDWKTTSKTHIKQWAQIYIYNYLLGGDQTQSYIFNVNLNKQITKKDFDTKERELLEKRLNLYLIYIKEDWKLKIT